MMEGSCKIPVGDPSAKVGIAEFGLWEMGKLLCCSHLSGRCHSNLKVEENVSAIHCKAERSISMRFIPPAAEASQISGDWLWMRLDLLCDEFPYLLGFSLLTGKTMRQVDRTPLELGHWGSLIHLFHGKCI